MSELQKETAIRNEQQQKSNKEIVDNIIKTLADNNLTITDAREILQITSKKLGKQIVKFSSDNSYCDNTYLKSIAESLDKIAHKGIDIFNTCRTTNK